MPNMKRYLGDGVYAEWDGFRLTLTVENGYEVLQSIVVDPDVYIALLDFGKVVGLTPPNGEAHD
jgi:hypothetical protein